MSDFILPDIGEGIVECELVKWLVSEGDWIEEDQPVAEVMTDKALVEIPAPYKGQITRLYYREGEIARVHEPLFALVAEDEKNEEADKGSDRDGTGAKAPGPAAGPAPSSARAEEESSGVSSPSSVVSEPEVAPVAKAPGDQRQSRIPASPAVRRLAREHGLKLADIRGSGKNGRVLKADVLAHAEQAAATDQPDVAPQPAPAREGGVRVEPIKGMQAVMARHMAHAASTIPHFTYGDEVDVTDLLALRERLKPEAEALSTRLTLMPFFMKAMALAVAEYPILNSRVNDDVTEIHYQAHCNIGMAVDSQAGLIVPNIKQVERRTLLDIAVEVTRLTTAAREGRVGQEDLRNGTISISNIGALGGTYASPIINAPEVAIVALGKTQRLPRFDAQGQVVERAIMTVSWAGDHRIIDGGTIARFCNRWKGFLESPQSMLLHLA